MQKIYLQMAAALALLIPGTSMAVDQPITKAPEGKVVAMSYSGNVWTCPQYLYQTYNDAGAVGEVVYTDNGEVYIKNILPSFFPPANTDWFPVNSGSEYYIKGKLEGDEVVIQLPQTAFTCSDSYGSYSYDIRMLKSTGLNQYDQPTYAPADDQVLRLKKDGDVLTWAGTGDDSLTIGNYSGNTWAMDCVWNFKAVPFNDVKVSVPEHLETYEYEFLYSGQKRLVSVGFDGNDVYVNNLSDYASEGWIKGTINEGKVNFGKEQYLGIDLEFNHYVYFCPVDVKTENGQQMAEFIDNLTFNYDEESKSMSSEGAFFINGSKELMRYYVLGENPILRKPKTFIESYVPANPTHLVYQDYDATFGETNDLGSMRFTFPIVSDKNDILDTDNLYYRIILNGEPFMFFPDEYPEIGAATTDIPYMMSDSGADQMILCNGTEHVVYFKFHEPESIGVQTVYKEGDKEYTSEIVYASLSGVETAVATEEAYVEYYTLDGVRVASPAKGMFIRKAVLTDGSVRSSKVVLN